MCFVCLSEETVPFSLNIISRLVFFLITEVDSAYCAVRAKYLYNIRFVHKGLIAVGER